jgi:hypothetical protein
VIEGVIRPRPMPSGPERPQALTPGAELLLYKRFLDNGAVAVEKVSVVVTDSFTTATVGPPPADMFRFTRPNGAQEVPNVASRRGKTP